MDDNRLRFGVGVLVIAAIGIGIILTFLFGAVPRVLTQEYAIDVEFPSAEGISTNTPVTLRGIKIGRVIEKKLGGKGVILRLGIEREFEGQLTHAYIPIIGTGSVITGDAKLEFVRGSDQELVGIHEERWPDLSNETYTDGQTLKYGQRKSDPFDLLFNLEDELKTTLQSVRSASGSLETVGLNVNQLVAEARQVVQEADQQVGGIGNEARDALIVFQEAINDVRKILGDEQLRANLKAATEELPKVLQEAQVTLQSTQRTFESFENVGSQFERVGQAAEKTVANVDSTVDTIRSTIKSAERSFQSAEQAIANIEQITEPIAENSDEIVAQALTSLRNLDRSLVQLETFGAALNNSDGTIRRLLEDDALYLRLVRTVENVEMASARLRPILDDVRIFSDKIARDPRQLGVRGAFDKRPSGAGLK
ncbi:MAG: MlaD family protein [Planctomycetota bacterium]